MSKLSDQVTGPIDSASIYTLQDFQERVGLARHAMMVARKQGLRTFRVGHRIYVRGSDFFEYLGTRTPVSGEVSHSVLPQADVAQPGN